MVAVLVVDDDKTSATTLADELLAANHDVTVVHSGKEALAAMQNKTMNLVITELMLPEVDGMQIISRIRSYYPDTVVIALTQPKSNGVDYLPLAKLVGADGCLSKPVTEDSLLGLVNELLTE